ncbi:MAG: thioredoxin family protein [Ferrovibrio sp.]|jgi:thioredoxin-related protein|uniref:thioredoxin family protein n=1 Tax=Ferrovibrio sp. TaxID=1917215 RepID=UPI00391DCEB3
MLSRRTLLRSALAAGLLLPGPARAARLNDDGLHVQDWWLESFLDLKQDIEDAAAKGKRVVLSFEQRGCIYCAEMHEKHLASPVISGYIRKHFEVIQLNLFGAREVTDLDGKTLPEKDMARKWGVTTTPTLFFLPPVAGNASVRDAASARMRGLLPPPTFLAMFRYVAEKAYERGEFPAYARQHEADLAKAIAAGMPIN